MDKIKHYYDAIVLGSGLKELLIATQLALSPSLKDKKVLLISSTEGYDSAETIDDDTKNKILEKFKSDYEQVENMDGVEKDKAQNIFPEFLKKSNDLYKDFENIRKVVEGTGLLRLLEIDHTIVCSHVFRVRIKHFIPTDADELLASGLMGVLEKRRFIAFRDYCAEYRQDVKQTHKDFDALDNKNSSLELYKDFGFDPYGQEFNGQAIARFSDERYLKERSYELIRRVQLCHNNLAGNAIAPFFLPLYRAARKSENEQSSVWEEIELLEDIRRFSRKNGNVDVLDHKDDEHGRIEVIQALNQTGIPKVKIGEKEITCKLIICHPEYSTDLCEEVGKVARQVFLCKKFDLIREYQCCHWRVPFRQMRKYYNKRSDICITFLSPQAVLSKKFGGAGQTFRTPSGADKPFHTPLNADEFSSTCTKGEESLYICMIETMDDTKENEKALTEKKSKPSTSKEASSSSSQDADSSAAPFGQSTEITIQKVEKKLTEGLDWAHLTGEQDTQIIVESYKVVKSTLWKPKMDLYKPDNNNEYHFENTKVLVTNSSEMSTPFEVICGEVSDIVKAIEGSTILH